MKHLLYRHQNVPPMLVALFRLVRGAVDRLMMTLASRPALTRRRLRVLRVAGVVFTLAIQVVLLWLLYGLVDLCISLMEVWAELAAKHLELTLDRTDS